MTTTYTQRAREWVRPITEEISRINQRLDEIARDLPKANAVGRKAMIEEAAELLTLDPDNCPHLRRIGDNYGESCSDCGKQLSGYGYGGFFGGRLRGNEECIHTFTSWAEGLECCIYCEDIREVK